MILETRYTKNPGGRKAKSRSIKQTVSRLGSGSILRWLFCKNTGIFKILVGRRFVKFFYSLKAKYAFLQKHATASGMLIGLLLEKIELKLQKDFVELTYRIHVFLDVFRSFLKLQSKFPASESTKYPINHSLCVPKKMEKDWSLMIWLRCSRGAPKSFFFHWNLKQNLVIRVKVSFWNELLPDNFFCIQAKASVQEPIFIQCLLFAFKFNWCWFILGTNVWQKPEMLVWTREMQFSHFCWNVFAKSSKGLRSKSEIVYKIVPLTGKIYSKSLSGHVGCSFNNSGENFSQILWIIIKLFFFRNKKFPSRK